MCSKPLPHVCIQTKQIFSCHIKQVQAVALHFSYSIIKIHTYIWYKRGLNRTNQSLLADDEDWYN